MLSLQYELAINTIEAELGSIELYRQSLHCANLFFRQKLREISVLYLQSDELSYSIR